jgi:hypothetical protein
MADIVAARDVRFPSSLLNSEYCEYHVNFFTQLPIKVRQTMSVAEVYVEKLS